MPLHHRARRVFQFRRLPFKIRPRPTPLFRRIARQFHAIDRKHFAADQPFRITYREHPGKHARDVVAPRADKARNRREMRRVIATQRHERHVLLARALNRATTHDALRIREQHDLQQHRGWICGRTRLVILKSRIEVRQVDVVIQQMIQRVLERARQQLTREVDRNQARLGIDLFVFCHPRLDVSMNTVHIIGQQRLQDLRTARGFCYSLVDMTGLLSSEMFRITCVVIASGGARRAVTGAGGLFDDESC